MLRLLRILFLLVFLAPAGRAAASDKPVGLIFYDQYHEFTTALDGGLVYGRELISLKLEGNVTKALRDVRGFKCEGNVCSVSVPHVTVHMVERDSEGYSVDISRPKRIGKTGYRYEKGPFTVKIRSNNSALFDAVPGEIVTEKTVSRTTHTVDSNGKFVALPLDQQTERVSLEVGTKASDDLEAVSMKRARGETYYIIKIFDVDRVEVAPLAGARDLLNSKED